MTPRRSAGFALLLLVTACSNPRRVAETALAAADSALASVPAEARDLMPDQVASLTEAVNVGRQSVEMGEYEAATTSLGGIPDQVKVLQDSIPARKAALAAEMDTLSVAMPRNLAAVKAELDKIARTGRRPQNLDREQLQEAQEAYAAAGPEWGDIKASFEAGKLADAMGRAHDLKARVSRAMLSLGLVADERAWSNVTLPPK